MTANQFDAFWNETYPEVLPVSYLFRHAYPDRWFRVHSLPQSKRYPETKKEYAILLHRQNTILTDLLGKKAEILLVITNWLDDIQNDWPDFLYSKPFCDLKSIAGTPIPKQQIDPDWDENAVYKPIIYTAIWEAGKFDSLLKRIANDEGRAFFVGIQQQCVIAPYDGGVDVLLKDRLTRNRYRTKYDKWLPQNEMGT
jgi:hypothetical protein